MAETPTTQIPLGFRAPDFSLYDTVSGKEISLADLASDKGTVIMFICNHCPYVKHVIHGIIELARDYIPKGIAFVAISSNDAVKYPDDGPEKMKELAAELNFPFVYLYDETQEVARAYAAACTPDFNIFDGDLKCIYRGQMDDARPGNGKAVTGRDIRDALDALISGKPVNSHQIPSVGCNIKWKS
ncbi:MAG TPA: thioredoxin family protein [Bacteroidales bacterium]|nr:thioredoxin family protein [Bacteroidales bacterium]